MVQAGVALRAVPRVLGIFFGVPHAAASLPEATSVRWWLQRLGLFALREALEVADDWVYLIDHSVQIGSVKFCVIDPPDSVIVTAFAWKPIRRAVSCTLPPPREAGTVNE